MAAKPAVRMPRPSPKTIRSPSPSTPITAVQFCSRARATARSILSRLVGLGEPVGKWPSGIEAQRLDRYAGQLQGGQQFRPGRAVEGVEHDAQAARVGRARCRPAAWRTRCTRGSG